MIPIDSFDDSRLWPYRNLKDRELSRTGDRFIAESEFVVRRLLTSSYLTESVLVAARKADTVAPAVPDSVPLYVLPDAALDQVIGYPFHTGVIAVGVRPRQTALPEICKPLGQRSMLVVCPDLNNVENLGALIRTATALGIDGLLLGEKCCDPFYRLAIRTSMGTVFKLPICRSRDIAADLAALRIDHHYQTVATVLCDDAEPLNRFKPASRTAILLGNEANGLSPADTAACDRRVTIPMENGADSLNVTTAAAIVMYGLLQSARV